ncbi:MAG: hypothetical protein ACO1QR_10480 [Chthoniobacteraceae bacterium]
MISVRRLVFVTSFTASILGGAVPSVSAAPAQPAAPAVAGAKVFAPTDLTGLRSELGKKVVVEGTLVLAGESKSGTVRYLNFTKNWRESVSLVFFVGMDDEAYSMEKLRTCVGRKVRATGVLSEYESNLQIQIDSWKQVQAIR